MYTSTPAQCAIPLLPGLLAVAVALAGPAAAQPADQAQPARWAVVSSGEVEASGLGDLMTAELSRREGFALVERDELRPAMRELELDALFAAGAAADRLRLGRLLGADALVLLGVQGRDEQTGEADATLVKQVICDCRYGARLDLACFPLADGRVDDVCRQCVERVEETRRRFAGGVRQLIGVTPLLSRNLVHDYDHLQAGYAHLLETALMAYPGVAVIETEEARAIARELEIGGAALADRVVPLFAGGEFEMTAAKPGTEPSVRLFVRATDGKEVRLEFERAGLPVADVPEIIRGTIAGRIAELARQQERPKISREEQLALLTRRAETFSLFGGYEHAAGLREAALLLEPGDVDLRLAVIGDYRRWFRAVYCRGDYYVISNPDNDMTEQGVVAVRETLRKKAIQARLLTFRRTASHVEDLIERRAVNPLEAGYLATHLVRGLETGEYVTEPAQATQFKTSAEEFFWNVFPRISELDYELREGRVSPAVADALQASGAPYNRPASATRQYSSWTRAGLKILIGQLPSVSLLPSRGPSDDRQTLDNLYRFLTEVAAKPVPSAEVMRLVTRSRNGVDLNRILDKGRLELGDVRRLYERLEKSGQPINVLYGRVGLLALRLYACDEKISPTALDECDRLDRALHELPSTGPDFESQVKICELPLKEMREEIVRRLGQPAQEKRHPLPENPIAGFDAAGRVAFEPVEGVRPDWVGLIRCTESLDVAWSREAVYAIPAEGTLRELFRLDESAERNTPAEHIYRAYWDGENIWFATAGQGVYVLSPEGRVEGHIGAEEGLPPYGYTPAPSPSSVFALGPYSVILHPLAPGRCIAVGSMGMREGRVWIAEIVKKEAGTSLVSFTVNVFHTARKTPPPQDVRPDDDPETTFIPAWATEYSHPESPSRLLLVGRQVRGGTEFTEGRRPLAVDLQTLAVSVLPARFHLSGYNWNPRYAVRGHVVYVASEGIELFSPPKNGVDGDWARKALVQPHPFRRPKLRPLLLNWQGVFYNPGAEWRRIDPADWTVQRLRTFSMPYQDPFTYYGVSAHYGPVAWSYGKRLYRVLIGPEPSEEDGLAAVYPGVPPDRLGEHHEAVLALRALGASVDTRWGVPPRDARWLASWQVGSKPETYRWRTIVFLPEAWRGGDRGLDHLAGLHNLCDLYLVRADVTDKGLETVGRIKTIESLYLVETRATDAGIASLAGLKELAYLRLEGTADSPAFSDQGLAHLAGHSGLKELTLYGSGFTDAGLAVLGGLPNLHDLWLFNTATTEPSLKKLGPPPAGRIRWRRDAYKSLVD